MFVSDLLIRIEQASDAPSVDSLLRAVFPTGNEARLVTTLRKKARPSLGLVALTRDGVIAHCLMTPVTSTSLEGARLLGLGPMAVAPGLQRQGIGSKLMRGALSAAKDTGAGALFVLGHSDFYPRFGFVPAQQHNINCAWDVPDEAFMVCPLRKEGLEGISGLVKYHAAFDGV
jgi:putative acetyltransferase